VVKTGFANDDLFRIQGQQILDTDQIYYLGGSLGGIMGNVFLAYDQTIIRGALGVPGGNWSLMFERSLAWGILQVAAKAAYRDPFEYQLLVSLVAMRFEPYDPITTAAGVVHAPLPDTPAKQILLYEALSDSLVSNVATEMVVRTMDVPVIGPSVRLPYGMELAADIPSSGFAIYDEKPTPEPPLTNVPPDDDNGTHGGVHERQAVLRQVERFIRTGEIVNGCLVNDEPAPCDCTTGACD